jgi:opacity protein-like surface antigen
MKKKFKGKVLVCLIMASLIILPSFIHAQKPKIKVAVENASIRIKPDAESEAIASPPVGTVFEVEAKVGEWYEIRIRTEVGVSITGYIHEMFVEIEKPVEKIPAPREEVKKWPVQPVPKPEPQEVTPPSPRIRASIKLAGLSSRQAGYDYKYSTTLYNETMTITDSVSNQFALGFNLELGVFVIKNIELTAGVSFLSKSLEGVYSLNLPNNYLYNDIAYDEAPANPNLKVTLINFGINFHLLSAGMLRPYIGAGGSYIMAKMDLLDEIIYEETFYTDYTHTIEITEVQFVETKINKFGFNVRAGINFEFTSNISLFAEGRYVVAKTEVPHPLTSKFDENEKLNIDLGGASGCFGIRFVF